MFQETFLAKITRPRPHNAYLREKFFDILDRCREKSVIWLSAPPGAGKTTLVSSYIESRKLRCLWYEVDSGDNDPATFFHYLGIAATKANPHKKESLPHLTPEYRQGISAFTREYFAKLYKLLGKNSLIIFDNYQEIPAESVLHEVIRDGLYNMPEGINVIMISRTVAPSILSRMRLAQSMEVVTWDELRLTVDEVRGIASQRGNKISDHDVRKMLSRTQGWVTGVMLMLDSVTMPVTPIDRRNPDSVFNYFAEGLFSKFSYEVRDFLLKTSVLPVMTAEMAEELTGNKRAESIISNLVDMNYFVQGHVSDQTHYQYHHLFREFLIARLKNETDPGDIVGIERKAAGLLVKNGQIDDAIGFYHRLGDWDCIADLVLKEAPNMLAQGRYQTLKEWLNCIPGNIIEETPWLLFWKGNCYLSFEQGKSRLFFEKAFEALYKKKDSCGIFLSWCGIVESIIHGFDDFKILDRWIGSLNSLLNEYPTFPSKEIEGRVSLFMFTALSFRAPQHPDINLWINKTCALLNETSNPDMIAQTGLNLVDYFIWIGDMEKAKVIVENLSRVVSSNRCSPMALISVRLAESLNFWYHGELESSIRAVSAGLKIAEGKGVNVFNYFLYGHGAVSSLTGGDINNSEEFLKKAASVLDDKKRFCASYYHHIAACHRLIKKDIYGAMEHESLALSLAVETGAPFAEAMTRTGMSLLHYELGERQEAYREISKANELALKTGSRLIEFICYLFEAYFNLDSGDRTLATEKLKKAMALGSKKGFMNFHMWRPDIMTRLCILALEERIEEEYVKKFILKRDLFPDDPPLEIFNWPWRLKIYMLGHFTIVKDGAPILFSKKAPRKTIDTLKLIIALGGKEVPEHQITDTLWPDADGDAAHVAFTTILKRLRNLLGSDDAILLRKGCLSLNQRYCWVDAMAFERLINLAEVRRENILDDASIDLLMNAIKMYGAGYGIGFNEDHWTILFYERIRSKFVRSVIKLGSYLEKIGKIEESIECSKKGIEKEPLAEELYQNLMVCLNRHGYKGEALTTYKRLTKIFSNVLSIELSPKTIHIYKSLSR